MDAEIKAKLEEMALKQSFYADPAFMAGAQAAWTLAVASERNRIANLILEISGGYTITIDRATWNRILTPEEVKT